MSKEKPVVFSGLGAEPGAQTIRSAQSIVRRGLKWCMVVAIAGAVLGCASGVTRVEGDRQPVAKTADLKYSALNVYLNDDAKKLLADNIKFNPDALKDTVQRSLQVKNLLAAGSPYRIDVEITDIRVRSNFAAVAFGFFAGSDSVKGKVYVKDSTGKLINQFEVSASYALGGLAGGQDDARMGWLYEEFARLTLKELSGDSRD